MPIAIVNCDCHNKNVANTITAEVRVPPHSNYTESVFLASEGEVLFSTNGSCQLSQTPQDNRYAMPTEPQEKQ